MGEPEDGRRRTRRRSRPQAQSGSDAADHPRPAPPPVPPAPRANETTKRRERRKRSRPGTAAAAEPGLHDIVGAGSSQLGVSGALRARDVNRPSESDLAEAEEQVVLVRRHWRPPPDRTK